MSGFPWSTGTVGRDLTISIKRDLLDSKRRRRSVGVLPPSCPRFLLVRGGIRMQGHVAAIRPSRTLSHRRCCADNARPLFAVNSSRLARSNCRNTYF